MIKPDLHMHSTASDGIRTPAELVELAIQCGVTIMAVTDHDTLDGADQLRGAATGIPVLTGTELSMKDMRGLHLLGYGLGDAPELRRTVRELAARRVTRTGRMIEKLNAIGIDITEADVRAQCQGTMGRLHIARAMIEKGYVASVREAFDRYIGHDGPGYVASERLCMAEALPLMRRNGFVPVLAHPAELGKDDMTLRTLLSAWKEQGLMGVEVYHPAQASRGYAQLDSMARSLGLLVTGGSDYHSTGDGRHGQPGCTAAFWRRAEEDVAALQEAMQAGAN